MSILTVCRKELSEAQRLAQLGSWQWDSKADLVTWSDQLFRIAGRDPSSPAPRYKELRPLYTTESWERLQRAVEEALRTGTPYELDLEMVRPDGTTRWVCARGEAVRDAMGRITRLRGTVQDITERKQAAEKLHELGARLAHAHEELKKSEEKFFKAFRESPVALTITSAKDHSYLDVSESFEQWSGWSRDEVIGPTPFDIGIWVNPAERLEYVRRILAEGIVSNLEFRCRRKHGVEMVGLGSGELIEIGNEQWIISAVADITEHKQAEEALRESEERLRLAQWAAHIGTFDLDLRSGMDIWTPEMEALYGLPPGGFGGTLTAFENLLHPADRERIFALIRTMIGTGQPAEAEWRAVWPDGSVHWIAGRAQVFMGESGEPSRMLGVNMDITERKRAEEIISAMTGKLIEAQEEERTWIARELHDDINQRLALLAINLEGVKQNQPSSNDEMRSRIDEAQKQVQQIAYDIQALTYRLHPSKLEYLGLEAASAGFCRELSQLKDVVIDFHSESVPKDLPKEVSLCLFRVLQEALQNAVKHSGARHFQVSLGEGTNEVVLTVRDSGVGFDPEQTIKRGLGLTSMRERLKLVNGNLFINSQPKRGTTIQARVPQHPR
jgi:PAS domain S-box-containing protein